MKQIIYLCVAGAALFGCAQNTRPPTDLISQTEAMVKEVETPESMQKAPLEVKKSAGTT